MTTTITVNVICEQIIKICVQNHLLHYSPSIFNTGASSQFISCPIMQVKIISLLAKKICIVVGNSPFSLVLLCYILFTIYDYYLFGFWL